MDALFFISTENGEFYYNLFYKLSFLLSFLLFVYIGIRRKYPLHTWLLLGTLGSISFIIGTKIGTYSLENWSFFFSNGYFEETHSKSLIGGLLFGLISILLAKRWFHFKPSLIDAYALVLPFALIVQRVGCLLAGCCFGTPTSLPWGVKYAAHFPIYEHHQNEGFINAASETSLAVHPAPLYLMLVYIIVLFLVWKTKNRWKFNGSLAFFTISLMLGLRFFVEFIRDSDTNHALGAFVFGLKEIQWVLILLVILFSSLLIIRERNGFFTFKSISYNTKGLRTHALMVTILLFFVWLAKDWFTTPETLIIHCKVVLILSVLGIQFWKVRKQNLFKYRMVGLACLSILFMSQTYEKGTTKSTDSTETKTHVFSFGARLSDIDLAYTENEYVGSGCNRSLVRSEFIEISPASSVGFQYLQKVEKERRKEKNKNKARKEFLFGAGLTYSTYKKKPLTRSSSNVTSIGVNILLGEDYKNFGYKLGAHLGRYTLLTERREQNNVLSREHVMNIFPITEIRVGPKQLYLIGSAGADFPYDILVSRYKVGLGLNARLFKLNNDSGLQFGIAENIDYNSFYIDANISLNNHFLIQPGIRFGKYPVYGIVLKYKMK